MEQIAAGAAAAHLARCESCRRLAALAGVAVAPASPTGDLDHLPLVDAEMYAEWTELAEARGGMGRISRARDRRLGRYVAIKQLRRDLSTDERAAMMRRFEREARLTARLQHPAIVGVHEAGRLAIENGETEPFYAMPLVNGVPLGDAIAKRTTLIDRLALLPHLTTVAEAVAYAHEEGIVHRDIKPDNVLVGAFGETVLLDWGLAKVLSEAGGDPAGAYRDVDQHNGGFTQLGVGTPQYMPPEQARGEEPDERVDVYALGATLYHLLAGVPPYGNDDPSMVRRALATAPPRRLAELAPDAPTELIDIVERAMARDPGARYARVRDLADELRRFQAGQILKSRRYTLGELARHFARRYRTALRISAVAMVLLVVLGVIAVVRIAHERDLAREAQQRAERELRRAEGMVASRIAPDPAQRMQAVVLGVRAVGPELAANQPPVPEAYQGLMDAVSAGAAVVPLPHRGAIKTMAPAGDKLVGVDDARALVVWNLRSGRLITTYPLTMGTPEVVGVSPDGRRAVISGFEATCEVIDLAAGVRRSVTARSNIGCAFLPDGRLLTSADEVTIRDPDSVTVLERYPLPSAATNTRVTKSGRVVAALLDGRFWSWRPGTAPVVSKTVSVGLGLYVDPEERMLYQAGADQVARAWPLDNLDATPTVVYADTRTHLAITSFRDDGRYLAIGLFDMNETRQTVVLDRRGIRPPIQLPMMTFAWWRDWGVANSATGGLELRDVESGGSVLALEGHRDEGALDTVGDKLASRSREGPALLWDPASELGALLGHTGEVVDIAVHGNRIATASLDGSLRLWRGTERTARGSELVNVRWLGDAVVAGTLAGGVRMLDPATGVATEHAIAKGPISALATGHDRILIGALDGTLELRDRTLGHPVVMRSSRPVTAAALSPDGTRVVSGHADGVVRSWDATTGSLLANRADDDVLEAPDDHEGAAKVSFTQAGDRILVSRPAGHLLVLDARTLATLARLDGRQVGEPAHSTGRERIAAALTDGTVLVHDLSGGTPLRLVGHGKAVLAAAFSPDGDRLATASADGTVRIWELATGASVSIASSFGAATSLAFVDPSWLVTGYASGAVRIHPTTPDATRERACAILDRFGRTDEAAPYCDPTTSERT